MKKIVFSIFAVMAIGVLMTGCGSSYDGNNKQVKKTVCDIASQELANKFTAAVYMGLTYREVDTKYAEMKKDLATDKYAKPTIEKVDEIMSKITLKLKNIRTDKVDKDVKKSYNSADLEVINAGTQKTEIIPITYTAQETKDGLYVEVSGLR